MGRVGFGPSCPAPVQNTGCDYIVVIGDLVSCHDLYKT